MADTRPIAILPARSGSKRIPKKNIKPFYGKPIIAYSIEAALKCDLFSQVVVSTDSTEIATVAESYGASVPFLRPTGLADDMTPFMEVCIHAIEALFGEGATPVHACLLMATAPTMRSEDIVEGYRLMVERNSSSVIPVTTFDFTIFRSFKVNESGYLEWIWPQYANARSNDLTEAYHDAGQFYWIRIDALRQRRRVMNVDTIPLIVPRYLVQDLDTPEDWEAAERMYHAALARA